MEAPHTSGSLADASPATITPMAVIEQFAKRIAERFQPERVVLFGSYARGDATSDSDVDLLVVMRTDEKPFWQSVKILQTVACPFATDLIVRTPDDLQRRMEWGDPFVREIVEHGVTLYESRR